MATVMVHSGSRINNFGDTLLAKTYAEWVAQCGHDPVADMIAPYLENEVGAKRVEPDTDTDMLILCGGGYFGEPPKSLYARLVWGNRMIERHIRPTRHAIGNDTAIAISGVGAGPITHPWARHLLKRVLRHSGEVTVRDEESRQFLLSLAPGRSVHVGADAALLSSVVGHHAARRRDRSRPQKPRILINMVKQGVDDARYAVLLDAIRRFAANPNWDCEFVFDQDGSDRSRADISDLETALGPDHGYKVHAYDTIDALLSRLADADLVLTTKLHVGIVSSAMGVPVLSFSGHTKTIRFFRQIGLPDRCLAFEDWTPERVSAQLARADGLIGTDVRIPDEVIESAEAMKARLVEQLQAL